jgi:predicted AlkP superfamily phosphohydrolase/phosphomutase/tetratricopeptide (TPR) repeat protein
MTNEINPSEKNAQRILIIGWDAADWMMIDPLIAKGKMPNLEKLIGNGVRANLGTLEPKLSPLLWTSITTGKTANKHGILNFVEPKPDGSGLRISRATTRKTKALWNIFSQAGFKTNVAGWYASHPAEPVNGIVISNVLSEAVSDNKNFVEEGAVHPSNMQEKINEGIQLPKNFPHDLLSFLLPKHRDIGSSDDRITHLKKLMSYAVSIENSIVSAMNNSSWDLSMVFFETIDTMGHHFMQYRPPRMNHVSNKEERWFGDVMDRVYEWHDQSLGRILDAAGKDTTVILLSDHGFHIGEMRPNLKDLSAEKRMEKEASWHRPFGVLVASGPGIKKEAPVAPCTILDVAPTALTLMGLPLGNDMDGRMLSEIFSFDAKENTINSWDEMEGDAGLHPDDMRQDPNESAASIQQLIDLGYLAALPEDVSEQLSLVRRESNFNLAVSLMSQHLYDEAIIYFNALLDELPDNIRYATCLSQCYCGLNKTSDAVNVLRELSHRHKTNAEVWIALAQALAIDEEIKESITIYAEAIRMIGKSMDFSESLANTALSQNRFDEAYLHAKKAVAKNPHDPICHLIIAKTELYRGNFEEAAGHALDALDLTQAIPEAHYLLGVSLAWYGDEESAKQSLAFAAAYDKESPQTPLFQLAIARKENNSSDAELYKRKYEEACLLKGTMHQKENAFGAEAFVRKFGKILF